MNKTFVHWVFVFIEWLSQLSIESVVVVFFREDCIYKKEKSIYSRSDESRAPIPVENWWSVFGIPAISSPPFTSPRTSRGGGRRKSSWGRLLEGKKRRGMQVITIRNVNKLFVCLGGCMFVETEAFETPAFGRIPWTLVMSHANENIAQPNPTERSLIKISWYSTRNQNKAHSSFYSQFFCTNLSIVR